MGCNNSTQASTPLHKKHAFSQDLLVQLQNNPESQASITDTKYRYQPLIEQSIAHYQKFIQSNPFIDHPFDGLGCIEDEVGYYEGKVVQWYKFNRSKGIIQGNPYDALSLCFSLKQQPLAGEKWYLSMLKNYPNLFQLYFGLGNLYYKSKHFDKAEQYYRKSFELNPRLQKAYQNIASIYCYHKYDNQQAQQWAMFAYKINKKNQYAKLILAIVNESNPVKYASLIKLSIKHPIYARVHNSIANSCLEAGETTEAIHWFTKATQINPSYFTPYCGLAIVYNMNKQHQKAIQMCKAALAINPDHYQPYASLAEAYSASGDLNLSKLNFNKCVQINPSLHFQFSRIISDDLLKSSQSIIEKSQQDVRKKTNEDANEVVEIKGQDCFGAQMPPLQFSLQVRLD